MYDIDLEISGFITSIERKLELLQKSTSRLQNELNHIKHSSADAKTRLLFLKSLDAVMSNIILAHDQEFLLLDRFHAKPKEFL